MNLITLLTFKRKPYVLLISQITFYKTDTFIRNKYMTYEYDLHQSKEEGNAEKNAKWLVICDQ